MVATFIEWFQHVRTVDFLRSRLLKRFAINVASGVPSPSRPYRAAILNSKQMNPHCFCRSGYWLPENLPCIRIHFLMKLNSLFHEKMKASK